MSITVSSGPSIRIENRQRRMLVFNVPHHICGGHARKRTVVGRLAYTPGGQFGVQGKAQALSESLTLLARGATGPHLSEPLHPDVAKAPEIVAVASGSPASVIIHHLTAEETAEVFAERDQARTESGLEAKKRDRMLKQKHRQREQGKAGLPPEQSEQAKGAKQSKVPRKGASPQAPGAGAGK